MKSSVIVSSHPHREIHRSRCRWAAARCSSLSLPNVGAANVECRTSPSTRVGYVAASKTASGPPSEMPKMKARSIPAASITARVSSTLSSIVGTAVERSDTPVPRLSNNTNVLKAANRSNTRRYSGASQAISMFWASGGITTIDAGPSPTT